MVQGRGSQPTLGQTRGASGEGQRGPVRWQAEVLEGQQGLGPWPVMVASESLPLGETNLSKLFEALILSAYFRGRKLVQDHNLLP